MLRYMTINATRGVVG